MLKTCHVIRRHCSSYVRRIRLQEKIVSSEDACRQHLPQGQFLVFRKGKPSLNEQRQLKWINYEEARQLSPILEENFVFLRLDNHTEAPLFAISTEVDAETHRFSDMRVAMFSQKDPVSNGLLTRAWSLLQWHRKTRFCANCGSKVVRTFTGDTRSCPSCQTVFYPSPVPVGIVLIAANDHSKVHELLNTWTKH